MRQPPTSATDSGSDRADRAEFPVASTTTRIALVLLVGWFVIMTGWGASHSLVEGRFYDERFSFENAGAILSGEIKPANGYYPSLAWMPQTAALALSRQIHTTTGFESFAIYEQQGGRTVFSPTSYLITRLFSVVYGAATLLVAFLLGRRVFSERAALLGTILLAMSPWMLRPAMEFKPDALLTLAILVTIYWSLGVASHPTLRGYLLVGLGVGLCVATKQNGVAAAVPIILATAALGRRSRRCFVWLVAAGATSLAVFLALNPYVGIVWDYLQRHAKFYNKRSSTLPEMFREGVLFVVSDGGLGMVVGVLGVLGLVVLSWMALRKGDLDGLPLLMFVSFPVAYWVLVSLTANYAKDNTYTPLLPFVALAGASLALRAWMGLERMVPLLGSTTIRATALSALVLVVAVPAHAYLYSMGMTGSTYDRAASELPEYLRSFTGRLAYYESEDGDLRIEAAGQRGNWAGRQRVPLLSAVDPSTLDFADIEIFPRFQLDRSDAEFYASRIEALDGRPVLEIEPHRFRVSGPPLLVLVHAWYPETGPVELTHEAIVGTQVRWTLDPDLEPGDILSFQFVVPRNRNPPEEVLVDGRPLLVYYGGWRGKDHIYVTERFRLEHSEAPLTATWSRRLQHRGAFQTFAHVWAESAEFPGRPRRRDRPGAP